MPDRRGPSAVLSAASLSLVLAAGVTVAAAALLQLAGRSETTETLLFILGFGVLLPASVLAAVRLLRERGEAAASRLAAVAAVSALALAAILLVARFADQVIGDKSGRLDILWRAADHESTFTLLLALSCVWALATAAAALWTRRDGWSVGTRAAWLSLALVPVLAVVFVSAAHPSLAALGVSVLLGAALLAAHWRLAQTRAPLLVDVLAVALILLVVFDLTIYTDAAGRADPYAPILQQHHNVFLGAANDVLQGRTLLVDVYPQYGVGNIYALAALFSLVPIGYGTFGLMVTAALAIVYAIAYAILRLAGCSQWLAAVALLTAVVTMVFSTLLSPATFPSLGAQRWGPAYVAILLVCLAVRRHGSPEPGWAAAAVLGLASIWSFEALVYCAAPLAAMAAYAAAIAPAGRRRAVLSRCLALGLVAVAVAQVVLTGFTLVRAGQLPDWGPYVATVSALAGDIEIPAPTWWIGLPVAALYGVSLFLAAVLVWCRPDAEASRRPALVAIVGLAAFGVASFTYPLRYSVPDAVMRHTLCPVLIAALWVHLAWGARTVPAAARLAVAATAFWLAGVAIVAGWGDVRGEIDRTALAVAAPGGRSPGEELSRSWGNPVVDPRAEAGANLLRRHWPGEARALVLLDAELSVEALMRAERTNLVPVHHFFTANQALASVAERVEPVIDELAPGALLLTDASYLDGRRRLDPGAGDLALEDLVARRLAARFRPRVVDRVPAAPQDLIVVRLERAAPG